MMFYLIRVMILEWSRGLIFFNLFHRFGLTMTQNSRQILILFVSTFITFDICFAFFLDIRYCLKVYVRFVKCEWKFFFDFFNFGEEDINSWWYWTHSFLIWLTIGDIMKSRLLTVKFFEFRQFLTKVQSIFNLKDFFINFIVAASNGAAFVIGGLWTDGLFEGLNSV